MKRVWALIAALMIAAMTIAACSSDEKFLPDISKNDIVGMWVYTADGGGTISYVFNDNSIYVKTDTTGPEETSAMGNFSVVDNKVCLIATSGEDALEHEITRFDGKTMIWKDSEREEMKFKKS